MKPKKLLYITTVPYFTRIILKGQLKYMNNFYEAVAVSSDGPDLKVVEEQEGIRVIPVEIKRKISIFEDISSVYNLYRLFRKEKPFMIHTMTPKAGLTGMLAGRLAGVPVRIHTFTGLIFPSRRGVFQRLLIAMDKLLCACATNVYPEGEGVKNDLIGYKITKKTLKVIANGSVNGIDVDYFNPSTITVEIKNNLREELGVSSDDFIFVFVGRLVPDKGIKELIAAFDSLCADNDKLKLLLVGMFEQQLTPLGEETLRCINDNKNIIHVGFKNDIRPYLSVSTVLVHPSYREGFPNVVMQAGAMGLPAIVTDISGSNEIIENNINGVIIPPKDVLVLQETMRKFIEDDGFVESLRRGSREMIVSRYEQKHVWECLKNEYQEITGDV